MSKQLKVDLIANTSQFKSAMSETAQNMKTIKSEMRATASETDKYGNKVQNQGARIKQLNGIMTEYRTRIKAIKDEQKHLTEEYKKGNITEKQHADAQRNLATRLNNTQAQMNKTEAQLKQLNAQGKTARRTFQDFDKSFRDVGRTMRTVGMQVGITAGIGFTAMKRVLGDVVNEAKDFQQGMAEVQAISGATSDELQGLTKQAKDLGKQTKYTAQEASNSMANLARAGFNTNEIMDSMPGLLDLAASSNVDLGNAADITANIIRGFGMEAKESGKIADVLAKGAATANTDVEGLGNSMATVAPVAHSLGVEFEDVAAATGIMADAGIDGSKAGRMLRQGMLRLSKPTGEAADLIDELGINVFDADGNMKSMDKVVKQLEKGLKGQTKQQKAAALATIFGSESTAGWSALLDKGSDSLKDYIIDLENAEGSAKDMADTMMNTAEGSIITMQSALSGLKIELGEKLLPTLAKGADMVTDFANNLSDMDEATIQTIAETALMVTAVLGVTTAVAGLVAGFGALMAFAGPVGLAIIGGTALLGGLAVALKHSENKTKKLAEEQSKAKEHAIRYGSGISEGTRKGVEGYVDLYEGAKTNMHKLKGMSGKEAEETKKLITSAFKQMGEEVISELEKFAEEFGKVIYEIFDIYGEEGQKQADKINKQVQKDIKEMINEYEYASQEIAEIQDKFGYDISQYPEEVRRSYDIALEKMRQGTEVFATTYEDALAVRNNIANNKDKILFKEAQKWAEEIEKVHIDGTKSINDQYVEQAEVIEKYKVLYPENAELYDEMMKQLQASTAEQYAKINKTREESVKELMNNTDLQGKLIDFATGKELERQTIVEQTGDGYQKVSKRREETDEEYLARYLETNKDFLNALSDNNSKTLDFIEQNAYDFYIQQGKTKDEAIKMAKEITDGTLSEFEKNDDKAKSAGSNKTTSFSDGMGNQKYRLESTTRDLSKTVSDTLGKTTDGGGGSKASQALIDGLNRRRESVRSAGQGVANRGVSGLKSVSTSGAGTDFVSGFRGSISNNTSSIWNTAWNLGQRALSGLRSSIKTASPSKLTAQTGEWFTEGFQIGIEDEERNAVNQAIQLARNTHGGMEDELSKMSRNFNAAAFSLEANKGVLTVQHEINNSSLESKISNLEGTVSKLTDTLITLTTTQHQQMQQVAEREIIVEMDSEKVGKATQKSVNKKTDDETKMKLQMLGII